MSENNHGIRQKERPMARMDLRLRAWGAVTRRQSSVATRTEAQVIALQNRKIPDGGPVALILGKAAPGVALADRSDPRARRRPPGPRLHPGGRPDPARPLVALLPRRRVRVRRRAASSATGSAARSRHGRRGRGRGRLPAGAGAPVPGRRRGLLRDRRLGGRRRGRARRRGAARSDGGERRRQPGGRRLPARPRPRRPGDQPPGIDVPGHRHDAATQGRGEPAVPCRSCRRRYRRLPPVYLGEAGDPADPWASPLLPPTSRAPRPR